MISRKRQDTPKVINEPLAPEPIDDGLTVKDMVSQRRRMVVAGLILGGLLVGAVVSSRFRMYNMNRALSDASEVAAAKRVNLGADKNFFPEGTTKVDGESIAVIFKALSRPDPSWRGKPPEWLPPLAIPSSVSPEKLAGFMELTNPIVSKLYNVFPDENMCDTMSTFTSVLMEYAGIPHSLVEGNVHYHDPNEKPRKGVRVDSKGGVTVGHTYIVVPVMVNGVVRQFRGDPTAKQFTDEDVGYAFTPRLRKLTQGRNRVESQVYRDFELIDGEKRDALIWKLKASPSIARLLEYMETRLEPFKAVK